MTKCKHIGSMFPVEDRMGWVVGYLCDCGHFEYRKDIPNYTQRRIEFMKRNPIINYGVREMKY